MTILPKKKAAKDKNDPENSEHSKTHHSTPAETRHEKVNRARTSPTRWLPATSIEEPQQVLPPAVPFEAHEPPPHNGNKRRHRSSPHRNVRKHKGHNSTVTSTPGAASTPPSDSPPDDGDFEEGYNSEDEYTAPTYQENIEELEKLFEQTLKEKKGWIVKRMGEDGACLFRAVADQVYGDQEMHNIIRKHCVDYMAKNAEYFSQYVTEDFDTYLNRKKMDHCHGNHVEMQAISEVFNRPIEVYQYSIEPINTFSCSYKTDNEPIRLSYHRNIHYNSVVDPYKATIGVGLGLPGMQPGMADLNLMRDATKQSERMHIEQCMFEDKIRETDWEVTQETIEEQVARESYLQWLRDNEMQDRRKETPKSASATCSSSSDSGSYPETVCAGEYRQGRSTRSKGNSSPVQNSSLSSEIPNLGSPVATGSRVGTGSPVDHNLVEGGALLGASGGMHPANSFNPGMAFSETRSIMNAYAENIDYSGWNYEDEDDILAQVMAQSQREYLDTLKKNASHSSSSSSSFLPSSASASYPPGATNS